MPATDNDSQGGQEMVSLGVIFVPAALLSLMTKNARGTFRRSTRNGVILGLASATSGGLICNINWNKPKGDDDPDLLDATVTGMAFGGMIGFFGGFTPTITWMLLRRPRRRRW